MCTASKGRTHGCNDQCCKTVKKALAKPEPSTHGTFKTCPRILSMSVHRGRPAVAVARSSRRAKRDIGETKSNIPVLTVNRFTHGLGGDMIDCSAGLRVRTIEL